MDNRFASGRGIKPDFDALDMYGEDPENDEMEEGNEPTEDRVIEIDEFLDEGGKRHINNEKIARQAEADIRKNKDLEEDEEDTTGAGEDDADVEIDEDDEEIPDLWDELNSSDLGSLSEEDGDWNE